MERPEADAASDRIGGLARLFTSVVVPHETERIHLAIHFRDAFERETSPVATRAAISVAGMYPSSRSLIGLFYFTIGRRTLWPSSE